MTKVRGAETSVVIPPASQSLISWECPWNLLQWIHSPHCQGCNFGGGGGVKERRKTYGFWNTKTKRRQCSFYFQNFPLWRTTKWQCRTPQQVLLSSLSRLKSLNSMWSTLFWFQSNTLLMRTYVGATWLGIRLVLHILQRMAMLSPTRVCTRMTSSISITTYSSNTVGGGGAHGILWEGVPSFRKRAIDTDWKVVEKWKPDISVNVVVLEQLR